MPTECIMCSLFVAVITIVNCISVKAAVRMQDAFTYAKLICVAMLTIIGIIELSKGIKPSILPYLFELIQKFKFHLHNSLIFLTLIYFHETIVFKAAIGFRSVCFEGFRFYKHCFI